MSTIQTDTRVDAKKIKKPSFWLFILIPIALMPVIYLGWLISATAVNVIYVDEGAFLVLFRHLAAHHLTIGDLLAQHNESRATFPLMIIVAVGAITHCDVRYDMWIEFGFTCLVSLNVYLLSRRVMGVSRNQCLFLWIITNILLFSTEQSQNWTWGMQMIVVMPMLCISTAMLIAYSRIDVTAKFLLAIVLATAATYSYAIGQIAWIILLPLLIVGSRNQTRRFGWQLALWIAACAANLGVYYHDYYKPPWHPSLLLALKHPIQAMQYFTAFLGASLAQGYHRVWLSSLFGVVLLICLASACVYLWRIRRQPGVVDGATVWLVLCAFTIAAACTTTAGRLGFGVLQSQDSRYTGFSIYLVIGLTYLGAMIIRNVYRQRASISAWVRAALGLALIVIPSITTEIGGTRQMWDDRRVRLADKAAIQLLNLFPSPQGVFLTSKIRLQKDFMDETGILSPGLVKSRDLSKIAGSGGGDSFGCLDGIDPAGNSSWHAFGWAILPYRHDPGEMVLLAGEDGHGTAQAFAEILVGVERPDVVKALHERAYKTSGWSFTFESSDVPAGTNTISAWVYDPQTGLAYRLGWARPFIRASGPTSRQNAVGRHAG